MLGFVAATVDNLESDGSVCYRGLLLGSGWQGETSSDGAQLGASGGGLQLKAVRFELSGGLAERYDVWYRSCDSARGWLGWASAGEPSGVESGASGLTAVQVALVAKGSGAPGPAEGAYVSGAASGPSLVLQGHVAERGWLPAVGGGEDVGTTGRGLALQAVRASLEGAGEGELRLRRGPRGRHRLAGRRLRPLLRRHGGAGPRRPGREGVPLRPRLRALRRVVPRPRGRLRLARLGQGRRGRGHRGLGVQAEALQAVLVEKGGDAPSTGDPAELSVPSLSLRAHVSGVGWQPAVGNGGTAGTTGQSRAVEAIAAEVSSPVSGGLSYSAHVSGVGWQDEVSGGAVAGTTGQGRAVECVKMRLTGDLSEYYDVWYRAYVQDYGWLGWASDGARAGTTGIGYRVEALQVRVLAKGSAAPGPTDGAYRDVADEKVIGVPRIRLVTWLTQHQYDGYYLGTPYSTGFSIPTCTYPNGERRWDGYSGMNCTGFVAHAWSKCGGNLAAVAANNSHSPWAGGPGGGGYINAWRFYGYAIDSGSKVYEFNKVQDLLNSGLARKGDVIFFKTAPNVDCHIGFFLGCQSSGQ